METTIVYRGYIGVILNNAEESLTFVLNPNSHWERVKMLVTPASKLTDSASQQRILYDFDGSRTRLHGTEAPTAALATSGTTSMDNCVLVIARKADTIVAPGIIVRKQALHDCSCAYITMMNTKGKFENKTNKEEN